MSEQDGTQVHTKRHRSRQTGKQNSIQASVMQRPTNDDKEAWKAYWTAQGQPWRTEPEIDPERQQELAKRRITMIDADEGIYPFRGTKLNRADVEWLLATHESGGMRGPIDWADESQRNREGLDLRGADLRGVELQNLPLACMLGNVTKKDKDSMLPTWTHLEGVSLEGANLSNAHLENADLKQVNMKEAFCVRTHLEGADFRWAQLERTHFDEAHLEGAMLSSASLKEAYLVRAHLENADLSGAYLGEADLSGANLKGAELYGTEMSNEKGVGPKVLHVHWDDINLSSIQWSKVKILLDEKNTRQKYEEMPDALFVGNKEARLRRYQAAVRANRQLAVALRDQGLNEEADYFAYRAKKLQRVVLRREGFGPQVSLWQRLRKFSSYAFSLFLDLLAGYGYRPGRSIVAYLVIIFGFMGLYLLNSHLATPHLRWDEALVLSASSFHGRGFFSQNITLGDTYARLASAEAVVGLVVEISFIATFTQRFFGK